MKATPRLIRFNKPYGVLSQFTAEGRWRGLKDFIDLPGVYVAGRLDADSEGLLLLTRRRPPAGPHCRPAPQDGKDLLGAGRGRARARPRWRAAQRRALNDGPTLPARARAMEPPEPLWERDPPIRVRKAIPTAWLELVIREGRNRQVRRMTAAVGHPTLRLIRAAIGPYSLEGSAVLPSKTTALHRPNSPRCARPRRLARFLPCRVQVTQCDAMLRYAGKLAGLYPTDAYQALLCDEVMYVVEEAGVKMGPTFRMTGDEQKAARLALVNGSMPVYLAWLQARLQAQGGEYFADGRLTVADLKVFVDVRALNSGRFDHIPTDLIAKVAPALNAHNQRIAQHAGVAAYYAKVAAK
jgi:pseudouridine synthase